jgi:hypothetical protein
MQYTICNSEVEIWQMAIHHDNAPAHQTQLVHQPVAKRNIHVQHSKPLCS